MKNNLFILVFLVFIIFSGCGEPPIERTVTYNQTGTHDGYDYEFWKNENATGKMIIGHQGTFRCEWTKNNNTSNGNILFRSGRRFGSSQTYKQVGNISFKYDALFQPNSGGASYLSIYGWTQNPLVEYYIVDNYLGGYHPGSGGTKKGSFTIAGEGTYDIFTRDMKNAPAIQGSGLYNFTQYISVRTDKRTSGTISVTKHFAEWEKAGLNMQGTLYEAMMKVEGYNNSGYAEITENILTIE
ncbi:MAG: glycoside hydrolase family 11 protein [Treponema sp.]|nr:glycoside hydrolase family 11 protein [Treponema sp.]MCL2251596.1 glycoside hydrolase family 11 protein [Treponema sp.]